MSVLDRWRDFRRTQRELLRASNHPHDRDGVRTEGPGLLTNLLATDEASADEEGPAASPPADSADSPEVTGVATRTAVDDTPTGPEPLPFGRAGRPLNRQSPFYMGFVGALGVLVALGLWHLVGRLTTVITLLVIAFFLTLALNPLVEFLTRRLPRPRRPAPTSASTR
jgi:hypothetical protein